MFAFFFRGETLADIVCPTKGTVFNSFFFFLKNIFFFIAENGKLMHFYLQSNSGDILSVFYIPADVFRSQISTAGALN